jgi:hypothetical protein
MRAGVELKVHFFPICVKGPSEKSAPVRQIVPLSDYYIAKM